MDFIIREITTILSLWKDNNPYFFMTNKVRLHEKKIAVTLKNNKFAAASTKIFTFSLHKQDNRQTIMEKICIHCEHFSTIFRRRRRSRLASLSAKLWTYFTPNVHAKVTIKYIKLKSKTPCNLNSYYEYVRPIFVWEP